MDIKDFILIGGGVLIATVVAHGFWIALRAKRATLRMDIVPDLIPDDDMDEFERLRGELPNGPARIRPGARHLIPEENLELELTAPPSPSLEPNVGRTEPGLSPVGAEQRERSKVRQAPPRQSDGGFNQDGQGDLIEQASDEAQANSRANVREVSLASEERVPQGPKNPALERTLNRRRARSERVKVQERTGARARVQNKKVEPPKDLPAVDELLVLNILASKGQRFRGDDIVSALRAQSLRYGDMNIFHRISPATKLKRYSIANAMEPGTFDLSDIASLQSPGMTCFMQLPGPDDALETFEDMLRAARNIARSLGGEIRDENMSVLSAQTVEHMRQRIADFSRRQLSLRAQTLG